jgi:hypothetical protein
VNRHIFWTLFLAVMPVVLFLGGCSCDESALTQLGPFADYLYDVENNDLITEANKVMSQNPIVGYFDDKGNIGDRDFFLVQFSQLNTTYKLIQSPVPGIDTRITLYDMDKRRLFTIDEQGKGQAEVLWDYYPGGEMLYMQVESKTGKNTTVPYVVNFMPRTKDSIDEVEPNDKQDRALLLRVDDTKRGLLSPKDDVDFYRVHVPDRSQNDFTVSVETLSNLDINFSLVDLESGLEKKINMFSWGGSESFPYLDTEKGDFYVRVSGSRRTYDRKDPVYYIELQKLPDTVSGEQVYYEREFNDTMESSTEIIPDVDMVGGYFPRDDVDWFKFDCFKRTKSVDISLSRVRGVDPILEVYDKSGSLVNQVDNNGRDNGEQTSLSKLAKGRYYIKVYGDRHSLLQYRLFCNIRY